ncbi:hypothetical protein LF1_49460 [Rubripirellula obstinata]|uniref:DUF58 domain-containing protein n=1 Tax=Rubripirellula obstinata TaxID=406547 RepID=A0A5B1CPS9_9BACT|nr:DUF58 domain-containing protein [Rubripirellula obstinata]KAA1262382.1 hypothetical protein LF1_49460 [Rubripirellula obstinata]
MTWQRNRLTRLGVHFLFVGSFALIGGALRGFNLLLILAGLVIGILLMHWRWSRRSLEELKVSRRLPGEAFAGKPFRIGYQIQSTSRFLPVWMLRVEDNVSAYRTTPSTGGKWNRLISKSSFFSKFVNATLVCGVGVVPPKQTRCANCDCTITQRGVYQLGPIRLLSCFPFALMTACKVFPATEKLYVYPRLLPLKQNWGRDLTSTVGSDSTSVKRSGGERGEFFGLREWRSGDSTQLIHWRTTARTGVPAVRQFEQKRSFDLCLLLDAFDQRTGQSENGVYKNVDAMDGWLHEDPVFEKAACLCASLVCQMQKLMSNRFVLAVAGSVSTVVQSNGQRGGAELSKRRMLQLLSETDAVETPKLADAIAMASKLVGRSQDLVVVSTRSMNDAILSEPGLKEAVAVWNRQNVLRWIDVRSSDFGRFVAEKKVVMSRPGATS